MIPLHRSDLAEILQEMAAMYPAVLFNEFMVTAYYRILKPFPVEAVRKSCLQLMGDEQRKNFMPSAAEIKAGAREQQNTDDTQLYLPCQHQGCKSIIAWPPAHDKPDQTGSAEYRFYCPLHRPVHGHPATAEEKIEITRGLTPKGRAFLRCCLSELISAVPITDEELAYTEPEDTYPLHTFHTDISEKRVAEAYGATATEVKAAQANASRRTLEHV